MKLTTADELRIEYAEMIYQKIADKFTAGGTLDDASIATIARIFCALCLRTASGGRSDQMEVVRE